MARVELEYPYSGLRGKLSKDGKVVFRTMYGRVSAYELRHPRKVFSAAERAAQARNGALMREACAIVKDASRWSAYAEGWEREGKYRYSKPRYYVQHVLGLNGKL